FDGQDVPEMRDLPRIVADTAVGKTVDVIVLRKDERINVKVKVGRLEEGEKLMASSQSGDNGSEGEAGDATESQEILGLTLGEITSQAREQYKIAEDVEGVLVTAVAPGSAAEEKRIAPGDVIVEVGQEKVSTPDDVRQRVDELKKAGRKSALLLISSKESELSFVPLRIEDAE
ncbi:MAG TPA: PDZ domain-containing protein, partial [Afifellaceae bacterium]|nr:PDZ domain-containing protein [Afifellaceae bacterium]